MLGTSHSDPSNKKHSYHHHIHSMQSEIDLEETQSNRISQTDHQSHQESNIPANGKQIQMESPVPASPSEEIIFPETDQTLPKPSPRNIFTATHDPSSNLDVEIFLKSLDSDPANLDPKVPYLKPPSSSRVSFNRKVKMKEVGRYLPSSSPSQQPQKSSGNGVSKKKKSSLNSPRSHAIAKMSKIYNENIHHEDKGRSLGSIYLSEAHSKVAVQSNSALLNLPQTRPFGTPTSILSSSGLSSDVEMGEIDPKEKLISSFNSIAQISCASAAKSNVPTTNKATLDSIPWRPRINPSISNIQKKPKIISVSIAYLWERIKIFEIEKNCAINVKKSQLSISADSLLISEGDNVQLRLDKRDILTIQHAPMHACYPYSFVKIMLKNGCEYLIAINGPDKNLITNLRTMNISASPLPHEVYARALSLIESLAPSLISNSPQSTRIVQTESEEGNPPPNVSLQTRPVSTASYDNKVLYLWEQHWETNNLKEITLSNARISLVGQALEIVDDAYLHLCIQIKDICNVLHAHHHYLSAESSDEFSGIPYSMVKISTDSKIDYLVSVEGNMIPLLGKLIDQLVSVISMNEADFETIRGLVQGQIDCETPSKIAGGILKKRKS